MTIKHPHQIIIYRYDKVVRLPKWIERNYPTMLTKGQIVCRTSQDTVIMNNGQAVRLGESYTKFSHYE